MCAVFFCLVADFTSCSHWHVQLYPFFGSCIFPNQSFIVGLSFPQTIKERLIVALGRSQESELKQSIRSFKVYSDILSGKSNKSIAKANAMVGFVVCADITQKALVQCREEHKRSKHNKSRTIKRSEHGYLLSFSLFLVIVHSVLDVCITWAIQPWQYLFPFLCSGSRPAHA